MAADTSSLANWSLVGYGGLGWATPPTLTSFSSSLPLPLGILSWELTTPNLGFRFNSNSGSEPSYSTKPPLPSSFVLPVPLHLRLQHRYLLPLPSLFQTSIQLVSLFSLSNLGIKLLVFVIGIEIWPFDAAHSCRFAVARWWRLLHSREFIARWGSTARRGSFL